MSLFSHMNIVLAEPVLVLADDAPSYEAFLHRLRQTMASAAISPGQDMQSQLGRDHTTELTPVTKVILRGNSHVVSLILTNVNTERGQQDHSTMTTAWQQVKTAQRYVDLCGAAVAMIAIGPDSAQLLRADCRTPILLVLSPQQHADKLINRASNTPVSAIYLEADQILNLQLIHNTLPDAKRVGVLMAKTIGPLRQRLRMAAARLNLSLVEIEAANDDDAVRQLRHQVDKLDALLLLADSTLVNDWSLKPILLMTVRQHVPVFGGVTDKYVKAGVTAAVIPDLAALPAQINTMLAQMRAGNIPPADYPRTTAIVINKLLAQTFALRTEDLGIYHGVP